MPLHFRVIGVPIPKGSTKAFGFYAKNKSTGALLLNRLGKPIILTSTSNANAKTKGWQQLVAEGASGAIQALPASERGLLCAGVRLTIAFYLPRPKAIQKRGLNPPHLKAPDVSKLVRCVEDALTGIVYTDDSQVVDLVAMKRYAPIDAPAFCDVWVEASDGVNQLPRDQPLFTHVTEAP